jgi:hypothetical protein
MLLRALFLIWWSRFVGNLIAQDCLVGISSRISVMNIICYLLDKSKLWALCTNIRAPYLTHTCRFSLTCHSTLSIPIGAFPSECSHQSALVQVLSSECSCNPLNLWDSNSGSGLYNVILIAMHSANDGQICTVLSSFAVALGELALCTQIVIIIQIYHPNWQVHRSIQLGG